MINNKFPKFIKGNVLTRELLEEVRDYPIDAFNTFLYDYSDGIIKGFELNIVDEELEISEGIFKLDNKLFIKKDKNILLLPENPGFYYINMIFTNKKDGDFDFLSLDIVFSSTKAKKNEYELGRINYIGGKIHCSNNAFEDFIKYDSNHIEIINVKYADIGKYKISNEVLYFFGKALLKKKMIEYSPLDLNFALQAVNKTVTSDLLIQYINLKLGKDNDFYSNEEVYNELKKILHNFKPLRYTIEKDSLENNNFAKLDQNQIFVT